MGKIKERILYELSREPQNRKSSLQDLAKRLLIGFFVMMLLLTAVSKAADSVTVSKVETTRVKGGVLSYEVNGSGTIEANAEKYLDLYEGVRIMDIAAKEGQPVKEGDCLFSYDTQELMALKENLENELTIAKLNLEKGKLSYEADMTSSGTQAAIITRQRAELDLKIAEKDLEIARNNIEKGKKEQLEAAEEAYSDAEKAKTEKEEDRDEAIKQGKKEVTKAEEALDELYVDKRKTEAVVADYKSAVLSSTTKLVVPQPDNAENMVSSDSNNNLYFNDDDFNKALISINDNFSDMLSRVFDKTDDTTAVDKTDPLSVAEANIFIQYYGKDEYSNHVEEVQEARQTLTRAKEDYLLLFIGAAESGGILSTSQKSACIRAYQDAGKALIKLTKKDMELSEAILIYGAALQSKVESEILSTYNTLISLLYKEDEGRLKEIKAATELVATGQEKLTQLMKEWNRGMEKAEKEVSLAKEELSKAQETYNQILNESYDYSADTRTQESQVEIARRSVEDAIDNQAKAKDNDDRTLTANNTKEQLSRLDTEIYELDVEDKKEAVDKVKEILAQDGQVYAPVSGILLHIDLAVGIKIVGTEKVSISLEDYEFYTKVTKDEAKRLSAGDEISIKLNNSRKGITSVIESIGSEDSQGMAEIAAILPEGEYAAGTSASFSVSKRSEQYMQTIPLQSVRSDANGANYVLVIQESNTSLGNELTAYRRNVTVLEKDYQTAAIEANLGAEDKIIIGSSKNIEEGDRVRISEGNE